MELGSTLLTTGLTCFVTLLVTYMFNKFTNRSKVRQEREEKAAQIRKKELNDVEERLSAAIQEVRDERIKEREACGKDHIELMKVVNKLSTDNSAQNKGLQAVLKDLLKVRYLKWIGAGYAPMDAKDDLEKMYQAYHGLGANGVMDALRAEFLELPATLATTSKKSKEE